MASPAGLFVELCMTLSRLIWRHGQQVEMAGGAAWARIGDQAGALAAWPDVLAVAAALLVLHKARTRRSRCRNGRARGAGQPGAVIFVKPPLREGADPRCAGSATPQPARPATCTKEQFMRSSLLTTAGLLALSLSMASALAADPSPPPPAAASAAASAPRKPRPMMTRARDGHCHREASEKRLQGKPRSDFMAECRRRR